MPGPLASLLTNGGYAKVGNALPQIIARSFQDDGSRQTVNETRRRASLALDIIAKIVDPESGIKWSLDKTLSHLPEMLRNRLEGIAWEPPTKRDQNRTTYNLDSLKIKEIERSILLKPKTPKGKTIIVAR